MPIRIEDFLKSIVPRNIDAFLITRTQTPKFHSYTAEKEGISLSLSVSVPGCVPFPEFWWDFIYSGCHFLQFGCLFYTQNNWTDGSQSAEPSPIPVAAAWSAYLFIYYEIVHEYTIKKKKKEKVKLSSTQKINHAINVLAVEKRRWKFELLVLHTQ